MASGPLVGDGDGGETQDRVYSRKYQSKPKNPKSVPSHYYQKQSSQQTLATTIDDNNFAQRQIMPVASDDSSSQPGAQNSREPSHGNAIPGYVKFDNFVKISFNLSNRVEVRALKRKLASELDQVTSLVKRLEATQIQLSKTVNKNAVRMNSEVCSVEPTNPCSFRGSTVSGNENANNHGVGGESMNKEKKVPQMNQYYKNLDAVVEKEKSSPIRGNKKLKSNQMKHGFLLEKDLSRLFKSCRNLLEKLMKHKFGWVFNKPVDVKGLGLHDYYNIIKHPMDLGTVKAKLSKTVYKSPIEFAEDVRLTFSNAMLYNPKGQDVHVMADELSKVFEEKWTKVEADYNFSRLSKVGRNSGLPTATPKNVPAPLAPVHTPVPAPPPAPVRTPAPAPPPRPFEMRSLERVDSVTMAVDLKTDVTSLAYQGRTPVPKKPAKDPDKRDMTYEEKQRLSMNLQELPSDKLDNVVQIIKKRNQVLSQQEDEIEVDIDSFDPETLWELHRFVTNYKKSLSKNKRKAEVAHQVTAEDAHNIQATNMEPLIVEEETAGVDNVVATSLSVQGEKHGDNATESSSSSGSGSNSGSSSSGKC